MKSTNNISGLLKRLLLFLTPMFLAIATYAYLDPFKVVLHYDSVYAHNYTGGVGLNAGYVSTATFDNNCKHIAYNSFIFGNSRSIYYRVYEWQKYLSHGCMPYHFDASAETIDGIARKMAYIQSKGLRIHNALLIIDASVVSRTTPLDGHLYALPPQLCAYRNFLKFHTDFLSAFLNPKFLCAFTDYSINGKIKDYMKHDYLLSDEQKAEYDRLLDVSGLGVMGYIEIPSIDCSLPIYHGTEESVLQIAVGHLKWSSLPVGGESTHCVLSGHRGLPSAKLFTNLDKLQAGDIFLLRVLDEVLTYEVDQILIVEPQETGALRIEKGKDYCTLVTCTPYGINTHRLLVRGHRIDNIEEAKTVRVTADAIQIEPLLVAPVVAIPILLLLMILLLLPKQPRKKHGGDADEED